jgi:hypothetical protein
MFKVSRRNAAHLFVKEFQLGTIFAHLFVKEFQLGTIFAHLFVSRVSIGYHIYNRSSIPEGIYTSKAGSATGTMAEESIEACNVG